IYYFFFFSSRRRHTKSKRDLSSDVCSSDLRNCPASSNIGNQYQKWRAPGVEKRKLTVNRNVMIAPMLPMNESLAEKGRDAISKATTISVTPIRSETP